MTKTITKDNMKTFGNENVEQAVEKLATDIYEALAPCTEEHRIIGQTLQLLAANSSPVTPNEVAIHLQVSPDKITSVLRRFGAEFDHEGNILGIGLTLVTTPHIYKVNGRKLYTWCAADALAYPVILKQNVRIESSDPVSGKKIQVHVTPDGVEKIEPMGAVVSVIKKVDVTNVRASGCNNINFFSSPKTAAKWVAEHPNTTFYPVSDVYQALKQIHLNKYRDMMVESEREGSRMCC